MVFIPNQHNQSVLLTWKAPWWRLPLKAAFYYNYIWLGTNREVFGVQIELFLEVLFSSSVNHSTFKRRWVRIPANEYEFCNMLVVWIFELEIKNYKPVLIFRKRVKHILPCFLFLPNFINYLYHHRLYNQLFINSIWNISRFWFPELQVIKLSPTGFIKGDLHSAKLINNKITNNQSITQIIEILNSK